MGSKKQDIFLFLPSLVNAKEGLFFDVVCFVKNETNIESAALFSAAKLIQGATQKHDASAGHYHQPLLSLQGSSTQKTAT